MPSIDVAAPSTKIRIASDLSLHHLRPHRFHDIRLRRIVLRYIYMNQKLTHFVSSLQQFKTTCINQAANDGKLGYSFLCRFAIAVWGIAIMYAYATIDSFITFMPSIRLIFCPGGMPLAIISCKQSQTSSRYVELLSMAL